MVYYHIVHTKNILLAAPPEFKACKQNLPYIDPLYVGNWVSKGVCDHIRLELLLWRVGREVEVWIQCEDVKSLGRGLLQWIYCQS